jgi:diguanylate cyclase (GGDEF)-like protein
MAIIHVDELYMGETAEIVAINSDCNDTKRLRNMGLREGRVVDMLHCDPLLSKKVVLGIDGTRLAFPLMLAAHIVVRPIRSYFETLRERANYDHLTGCLNRHAGHSIVKQEIDKYAEHEIPLAILMADIDHFKKVNDTYGHPAGDEVLKKFAQVAGSALRRSDLLCRWGGEEFLILLRGTEQEDAIETADRIRRRVESIIFHPYEDCGQLTVSIGSAAAPPKKQLEQLVIEADQALYRAKSEGRNRVVAFAQ